jgi:hypothetical protein
LAKLKDTVEKSLVLGDGMDKAVNQVKSFDRLEISKVVE